MFIQWERHIVSQCTVYGQRWQDKASDKLHVAEGFLEDTQGMLDQVADVVRRDEVCIDTVASLTLLKKLTETASGIPYHPSQEKPDKAC